MKASAANMNVAALKYTRTIDASSCQRSRNTYSDEARHSSGASLVNLLRKPTSITSLNRKHDSSDTSSLAVGGLSTRGSFGLRARNRPLQLVRFVAPFQTT